MPSCDQTEEVEPYVLQRIGLSSVDELCESESMAAFVDAMANKLGECIGVTRATRVAKHQHEQKVKQQQKALAQREQAQRKMRDKAKEQAEAEAAAAKAAEAELNATVFAALGWLFPLLASGAEGVAARSDHTAQCHPAPRAQGSPSARRPVPSSQRAFRAFRAPLTEIAGSPCARHRRCCHARRAASETTPSSSCCW